MDENSLLNSFHLPDPSRALLWIILLPMLGALINGIFGRRAPKAWVTGLAIGSVATAFVLALLSFSQVVMHHHAVEFAAYDWFKIYVPEVDMEGRTFAHTTVNVPVKFLMDQLSGIMTVMVTGIATLIHIYSSSYMGEDESYPRFMTYLNLFTASMLILVLASNVVLMFVGWEGVGVCSYLLIGFWYENRDYAAAGKKAFVVNRIGDFGVLLGAFLLVMQTKSFEFANINANAGTLATTALSVANHDFDMSIATAAALCLFLGCTGKSAQLPLYIWLPDAMAGPTPVSALIHAATMVTAGVYLCCRLSPVIITSETALATIAIVGTLTAFVAASIGLVQNQMKKILAYSTVSQLGFMFAAVGVGAFSAGIFHVFTHAFFKACLFLGAGSVMHAIHAHGDADIRYLGGLKKYMPKTRMTFLLACLAIAGFPLTSGFFSKDEILLGALESTQFFSPSLQWVGYFVFGMLTLTAGMTAFYMFRLYFRTFEGEFKGGHAPAEGHGHDEHHAHDDHAEPHECDNAVTIPLIVLAAFAMIVGFLGLPHWLGLPNLWGHFLVGEAGHLGPVSSWLTSPTASAAIHEGHHEGMGMGITAMSLGTVAGLGGIALAFAWYFKANGEVPAGIVSRFPGVHAFLMDKWRVDEFYAITVVRPLEAISRLSANIDKIAVDGLLTKLPSAASRGLGYVVTRTQTGSISTYATAFVLGLGGMLWWFTYPHPRVQVIGSPTTSEVSMTVAGGVGTEFRWDFDSDGDFQNSEWSTETDVTHDFKDDALIGLELVLTGAPAGQQREVEQRIRLNDEPSSLELGVYGPWARTSGGNAPTARMQGGKVFVRAGDAMAQQGTREASAPNDEFELRAGETMVLGNPARPITVRIDAVYEVTVEARNFFGNVASSSKDLAVRVQPMDLQPVASAR